MFFRLARILTVHADEHTRRWTQSTAVSDDMRIYSVSFSAAAAQDVSTPTLSTSFTFYRPGPLKTTHTLFAVVETPREYLKMHDLLLPAIVSTLAQAYSDDMDKRHEMECTPGEPLPTPDSNTIDHAIRFGVAAVLPTHGQVAVGVGVYNNIDNKLKFAFNSNTKHGVTRALVGRYHASDQTSTWAGLEKGPPLSSYSFEFFGNDDTRSEDGVSLATAQTIGKGDFVVLASRHVWDTMNEQEVGDLVAKSKASRSMRRLPFGLSHSEFEGSNVGEHLARAVVSKTQALEGSTPETPRAHNGIAIQVIFFE